MKKILLIALVLCCAALPALAEGRIYDEADLFSEETEIRLEDAMASLAADCQVEPVILTRLSIGYQEPRVYAADFLESIGLGDESGRDSVILLISMAERDLAVVTHGKGSRILTVPEQEEMLDALAPYLTRQSYEQAADIFLQQVRHEWENIPTPFSIAGDTLPVIFIGAAIITLIVMLVLKSQMKTVRRQAAASSYVEDGSFNLSRRQDIYLYTTTRRRKIESSSGGGSGGSFKSSSGGSYSGSSRKF